MGIEGRGWGYIVVTYYRVLLNPFWFLLSFYFILFFFKPLQASPSKVNTLFLDQLVLPCQTAFVPGRRGVDNAIIVHEIVHTIGKANGKAGYMAIKIDLEKSL